MKLVWSILLLCIAISASSQFTVIPTGTSSRIDDIVVDADTLIISCNSGYFGKYYLDAENMVEFTTPGPVDYFNSNLQIVDSAYYYIVSREGIPYDHNYVLKSTDFGNSWTALYDTIGLFYTMSILDSSYGIMAGTFGDNAVTVGDDSSWLLQDDLFSTILCSETFGDSTILLTTLGGVRYLSEDKGNSWNWVIGETHVPKEIQFVTKDTIYSVAYDGTTNPKSYFHYSVDGGYSWNWKDLAYDSGALGHDYWSRLFDLEFENSEFGWGLGYVEKTTPSFGGETINQATLFQFSDFGMSWVPYLTGYSEELRVMTFLNDSVAFLGGENGLLLQWDLNSHLSNVLGSNELSNEFAVIIYPNPIGSEAEIIVPSNNLPISFNVIDASGRYIRSETIESANHIFSVDGLQGGVYFLDFGSFTKKILIE
ncbi:T9SS type A sorting domain-containing protein [Crocinitomix catalasitica]|nr:T9SS type A sorting domain-containing protein [Crocinitomix catalasitica]